MPIDKSDPDIPECFRGDIVIAGLTNEEDQPGYLTLRGVDSSNARNLKYSIERQVGAKFHVRSILRGVSDEAASVINVILDNTHTNDVVSREAILDLLRFRSIPGISAEARGLLAKQVPELLTEKYGSPQYPPELEQLLTAFAKIGDNPEVFMDIADTLTKGLTAKERGSLLMYFHILMRNDLPAIIATESQE